MTLSEAVRAAEKEQARCVVMKNPHGNEYRRVFVASGRLWQSLHNPDCLEPYRPTVDEITSDRWSPADEV